MRFETAIITGAGARNWMHRMCIQGR